MTIETKLTPWTPGVGASSWDDASNYIGDRIDGWFVYSKHRDSDHLVQSNYDVILKALQVVAGEDHSECVREDRVGHWAVGWIEQINVTARAPEAVIRKAEELLERLRDYPALDEDDWSTREYEAAASFWESCSPRERVRMAMEERKRYHWLQKEPVWRFGRMSYGDLSDAGTIGQALSESLRE